MGELTARDHVMFGKYYGRADLIEDDDFWQDVAEVYHDQLVPLPLEVNYRTIRLVSSFLKCPPGECGECCRYSTVALSGYDEERIREVIAADGVQAATVVQDGTRSIRSKGGCPFLKDNACSIYGNRPDICFTFPIQPGVTRTDGAGKATEQMHVRLKCGPAVEMVRKVLSRTLTKNPKLILLPDLTVIVKSGGGTNGKG